VVGGARAPQLSRGVRWLGTNEVNLRDKTVVACFLTLASLSAQGVCGTEPPSPADPSIEIEQVRSIEMVRVRQRVQAGDKELVIPVCGASVSEWQPLCTLAVTLEILSPRGWVAAPEPEEGPRLGGEPLTSVTPSVVTPHASALSS
jgi:hypothetical protein